MSQKGFADTQKALMEKRRENLKARFDEAREKAASKLKIGESIEMRRRKKRLFTESGQEYYQIEPLTKMTPLKTFNLVQNSMNKLAVNIEALGISNAIMKIG